MRGPRSRLCIHQHRRYAAELDPSRGRALRRPGNDALDPSNPRRISLDSGASLAAAVFDRSASPCAAIGAQAHGAAANGMCGDNRVRYAGTEGEPCGVWTGGERALHIRRQRPRGSAIMSIRPVKSIVQSTPTMEGAGVQLRRAFGFGKTDGLRSVPAAGRFPQRPARTTTSPAFPGIRIAASRPSPMCSPAPSITATAWATAARSAPATCSG